MNLVRKACDIQKWADAENVREIGESLFEELYLCIQQKHELSKVYFKVVGQMSIEEILPIDVWVIAILLKENLQAFQVGVGRDDDVDRTRFHPTVCSVAIGLLHLPNSDSKERNCHPACFQAVD